MSATAAKNVRAERAILAQMEPNLERAAAALLKHERLVAKGVVSRKGKKGAKGKSQLPGLEGGARSDVISLIITLKKVPSSVSSKPRYVPLPHSLYTDGRGGARICLFVKEPASDVRDRIEQELSELRRSASAAAKLGDLDVTVIGLQELREGYSRYEKQRQLLASYDLFMCDDRIVPMLGKALGKKVGL